MAKYTKLSEADIDGGLELNCNQKFAKVILLLYAKVILKVTF